MNAICPPPAGPLRPPHMDWVYRQSPVETFNGRRGHVCLALPDIIWAGGAPILNPVFLGAPSSQCSPDPDDDSTRFATTDWVRDLIDTLAPTQGPPGPQGPPGVGVMLLGSVATAADLPQTGLAVGDAYIALDTGILWVWDGNHWISMTLTTGPQGPVGPAGPQGQPGTNGTNGSPGAPGPPGTGFVFKGSVPTVGNLPPTGNTPGDVYLVTATGQNYVWDGTTWQPMATGPAGAQGPPGPAGPAGPTGAQGVPGATGNTGATGPAGAAGGIGPQGNPGATGPQGPAGPTGAQGPQGPQGPAGSGGVTTWNGRGGAVTMSSTDITNAGGLVNPNVALTGTPTAPTAPGGTNSTQIATTGYVYNNFVKIPGDTMTGALNITNSSGTPGIKLNITGTGSAVYSGGSTQYAADIMLNAQAGYNRQILATSNGSLRWSIMVASSLTESGNNSGSGFIINRFSDAGVGLDSPFQIGRNNGGVVVTQAITVSSSRALKEKIEPLKGALAKVKLLQGVAYHLKAEPKRRTIGLIGQDVEPVMPEVVSYSESGEIGIQYGSLVALLIEAVKELTETVERRAA